MCKPLTVATAIAVAAIAVAAPATARTSGAHWCRAGDPPLYASARTECPLAGTMITEYVNVCRESRSCIIGASSPNSRRRYRVTCHRTGSRYSGIVYCEAPAGAGIWVRFPALI